MKRLLILLLILNCTACTALPAEERAFAVALLVEAEDNQYRVYGRIPTYQTGGGYCTVQGEGSSLGAALLDMEGTSPMGGELSQLRLLVMDVGLKERIVPVLQELSERADVRQSCLAAVTEAKLSDLAEALKPSMGARLSKTLDILAETRQEQGRIPWTTLGDVILMAERECPVLPVVTLNKGQVELSGGKPVSMSGKLGSTLSEREYGLLALAKSETQRLEVTVPNGTARLRDGKTRNILAPTLTTAEVSIMLRLTDTACSEDELEEILAHELLALLTDLYAQGFDVLGLGRNAVCQTADWPSWQTLDWLEMLPQIRWKISVGVTGPV